MTQTDDDERDAIFALRAEGDLDGAIRLARDILSRNLNEPEIIIITGNLLGEAERFDEARRVFERGVSVNGQTPYLMANYATLLAHSGQFDEALSAVDELLERDAFGESLGDLKPWVGLLRARVLLEQGSTWRAYSESLLWAHPSYDERAHDMILRCYERMDSPALQERLTQQFERGYWLPASLEYLLYIALDADDNTQLEPLTRVLHGDGAWAVPLGDLSELLAEADARRQ